MPVCIETRYKNAACVHTGVHGPAHLDARIEAFVNSYAATLEAMPEAEWQGHRQALIQAKLQKDGSIGDEAERFWDLIANRRCVQMVVVL